MAEERTLGQLVADASADLSELVRYEVALAKAEIKNDLRRGVGAGGLFAAAGFLALLALITLVISAGYGLVAAGLSPWLAFLVLSGALLLIVVVLGLIGYVLVRRIKPPQRAIRSTRQTIAAVRGTRGGAKAS
jgi:Putative Actinobacterial Holin-X, holin superfamily III